MNFVEVTGGLGNQMFIYAFKVFMSQSEKTLLFHPYSNHSVHYGHAGFQLNTIFNIKQDTIPNKLILLLLNTYWHIIRLFPKSFKFSLLKIVGINVVSVSENFVFYPEITNQPYKNTLFRGTWQSEKYFNAVNQDIRASFFFKTELLNNATKCLLEKLKDTTLNTVSIHVRRTDYLSTQYAIGFSGICTLEYYKKAIKYINDLISNPVFIVFSDDIQWCKEHIKANGITYVDWNQGKDSWQDMFLMSHCKHNIIANSSFSWWGAWLNSNPDKIVIAPSLWWNGIKDDVVPDSWIRL